MNTGKVPNIPLAHFQEAYCLCPFTGFHLNTSSLQGSPETEVPQALLIGIQFKISSPCVSIKSPPQHYKSSCPVMQ